MPLKVDMPRDRRALALAPVAVTSGKTPLGRNANDVMRIGAEARPRGFDGGFENLLSCGASLARDLDDQDRVLGR